MSKCDAEIIVILWLHYLERGNSDYFSSPMTKFLFGYVESMVSVSGFLLGQLSWGRGDFAAFKQLFSA